MENELIVLIEKDSKTNGFIREVTSFALEHINLIHSLYIVSNNDEYTLHMCITTDRDVEDWEFEAIYDYYDDEALSEMVSSLEDIDEFYNPIWHISIPYIDDRVDMEIILNKIIVKHFELLCNSYIEIEENKLEYIQS
ncbi:MAG: DUF6762 family protein [Clostridium sp.]